MCFEKANVCFEKANVCFEKTYFFFFLRIRGVKTPRRIGGCSCVLGLGMWVYLHQIVHPLILGVIFARNKHFDLIHRYPVDIRVMNYPPSSRFLVSAVGTLWGDEDAVLQLESLLSLRGRVCNPNFVRGR